MDDFGTDPRGIAQGDRYTNAAVSGRSHLQKDGGSLVARRRKAQRGLGDVIAEVLWFEMGTCPAAFQLG